MLDSFFGEGNDQAAVLKAIKKCEIDKFRPLRNFLKKETESTDDKNIELLAWLIDFKDRPCDYTKSYNVDALEASGVQVEERIEEGDNEANPLEENAPAEEQEVTDPEPEEAEENIETEKKERIPEAQDQPEAPAPDAGTIKDPAAPVAVETPGTPEHAGPDKGSPMGVAIPEPKVRKPGSVFKRGLAAFAMALLALAGFWIYRGGKKEPEPIPMGQVLPVTKACMSWTGDHYEQVPCTSNAGDTGVVQLDPEKIRSFKKITRPDTITRQSKGSVWYVKINGAIEFYTADGFHPIDQQRRLKPITDYIIGKYIHPDPQAAGN
ncbi:MAG: hypothetical protein J7599_06330 [Niabella sp.]|nr:hypothetical protein [Niabella sp.]